MARRFEELDHRVTPIGEVSLRRRHDPVLQRDVHEVLLGDEYLMSSLFTDGEVALARLGLAAAHGDALDVVVGGLGLGWTARAALADPRVRSLTVVETVDAVIDWQVRGLLPHAEELTGDPRCRFVQADFFALVEQGAPLGPSGAVDVVLLDVDHTPSHVLHPSHAALYAPDGLRRLAAALRPGGVFALWADSGPEPAFSAALDEVFAEASATVVEFPNPLTGGTSSNVVHVARRRPAG